MEFHVWGFLQSPETRLDLRLSFSIAHFFSFWGFRSIFLNSPIASMFGFSHWFSVIAARVGKWVWCPGGYYPPVAASVSSARLCVLDPVNLWNVTRNSLPAVFPDLRYRFWFSVLISSKLNHITDLYCAYIMFVVIQERLNVHNCWLVIWSLRIDSLYSFHPHWIILRILSWFRLELHACSASE